MDALTLARNEQLLRLITVLIERNDLDTATENASAIADKNPDGWHGLVALARVDLARGDIEAAHKRIDRARTLEPKHPDVFRTAVAVALARTDTQSATQLTREWSESHPQSAEAFEALAQALTRAGDAQGAAQAHATATTLAPASQGTSHTQEWAGNTHRDVTFEEQDMTGVNMDNARFESGRWTRVRIKRGSAQKAHFERLSWNLVDAVEADFTDAVFEQMNIEDTGMSRANFLRARFVDCKFHTCQLRDAQLKDAVFERCHFVSGVNVEEAQLDGTQFLQCEGAYPRRRRT